MKHAHFFCALILIFMSYSNGAMNKDEVKEKIEFTAELVLKASLRKHPWVQWAENEEFPEIPHMKKWQTAQVEEENTVNGKIYIYSAPNQNESDSDSESDTLGSSKAVRTKYISSLVGNDGRILAYIRYCHYHNPKTDQKEGFITRIAYLREAMEYASQETRKDIEGANITLLNKIENSLQKNGCKKVSIACSRIETDEFYKRCGYIKNIKELK